MQLINFDNKVDKTILGDIFDRIAAQKLTVNGADDDLSLDSNGTIFKLKKLTPSLGRP